MTDVPPWAAERGREIVAAVLEGSAGAYSIKQTPPEETAAELVAFVARALTEAAPGWRTDMENVPCDCSTFVGGLWVKDKNGNREWEEYVISLDDETGEIQAIWECPWSITDFDAWMPLPAAPEVKP